jgi:alginate O-acetyltransferase complex protein AlgJ
MHRHHGPLWLVVVSTVLCLPLLVGLFAPDPDLIAQEETRRPAMAPEWPRSVAAFLSWPAAADAWLRDHFGLRRALIHAHSLIAYRWLGSGTQSAVIGLDGWMFLRAQDTLSQSAGLVLREDQVVATADTIARLHTSLAARGIRFTVAIPPNTSTIYPDHLPIWARNDGRRTEYDAFLKALHARRVPIVDLRPPLREARATDDVYYHHDTHWRPRGALIAFNTMAVATGHADWRFDPETVLAAPVERVGGDLANMLGMPNDVTESNQYLALPEGRQETLADPPFRTFRATLTATDAPPRLMIIGDSFTADYFIPMVLARTDPVIWTASILCAFDAKWIDKFRPAEVWWMPTERQMLCSHTAGNRQ